MTVMPQKRRASDGRGEGKAKAKAKGKAKDVDTLKRSLSIFSSRKLSYLKRYFSIISYCGVRLLRSHQ